MEITKQIGFDMGHRVPNHKSKCKNVHGHRYTCLVTMEGEIVEEKGVSDEGMVIDFSDIKSIANELLDGELDHGFMVYEGDEDLKNFLLNNEQKTIVVPFIPTAENIAKWIYDKLLPKYEDTYGTGLRLKKIKLYETPNSYAVYEPKCHLTMK